MFCFFSSHQMDIFNFFVGHLVLHSNIFCRTFIKNVWLSDRSDKFRQHCIYSNVLNLVPNHGTRILSLVGYYGLVLLFGQIPVLCLMISVDWNPSPDKYNSIGLCTLLLHITYHVNIYICSPASPLLITALLSFNHKKLTTLNKTYWYLIVELKPTFCQIHKKTRFHCEISYWMEHQAKKNMCVSYNPTDPALNPQLKFFPHSPDSGFCRHGFY